MKPVLVAAFAAVLVAAVAVAVSLHLKRPRDTRVRGTGTIEATEVAVAPKVSARIAGLHVDEGDRVHAGDPVAELACTALEDQVAQASAQADVAAAGWRQAQARAREAGVAGEPLRVQRALAERERTRTAALYGVQGATQSAVDHANASVDALDKQIDQAGAAARSASTAVSLASAQMAVAEAGVGMARAQLDECALTAPVDGVVLRKDREVGELVLPGSVIVQIGELDDVYTWIYVPNEEIGRVRIGEQADVVADTYPRRTFRGTVVHVNAQAEFTPKSIQTKEDRTRLVFGVKVDIPNADGALMPGMPVEAALADVDGAAK
jgi:HlyD family secretion protein